MLKTPTIEKLEQLRLHGMINALSEQNSEEYRKLDFIERFSLLVEREFSWKEDRQLKKRLTAAKLGIKDACIEGIEYDHPRVLEKSEVRNLSTCDWIRNKNNVLITGTTGSGKSYLACALGHKACLLGYTVQYFRASRLFPELVTAKIDGRWSKIISGLARINVLIIDDWGHSALDEEEQKNFMEIMADRYDASSTIVTSQLPIKNWHEIITIPTLADAIMDRLVHNAYKLNLKGDDSIRKRKNKIVLKEKTG